MLQPNDPQLQEIIEDATDDLISEVDMALDEGPWITRLYHRCDAMGLSIQDATKIREIAEEIMALQVSRSCLARLVVGEPQPSEQVFIQGAGWVKQVKPSAPPFDQDQEV